MFGRDRKVKKFAKEISEKQNSIFVFGSGTLSKQFVHDLIALGLGDKVALIAEEDREWIDDLPDDVSALVETKIEKYQERKLYELIGFSTAEKIIILTENSELVQAIINNIDNINDVNIIMISESAPPFIKYLSQAQRDKFIITDNVHSITADLYNLMGLPLNQPPVITVPIIKEFIGKTGLELDAILKKSKILRIERVKDDKQKILLPIENVLNEEDLIMVYLLEGEESIREIIDL